MFSPKNFMLSRPFLRASGHIRQTGVPPYLFLFYISDFHFARERVKNRINPQKHKTFCRLPCCLWTYFPFSAARMRAAAPRLFSSSRSRRRAAVARTSSSSLPETHSSMSGRSLSAVTSLELDAGARTDIFEEAVDLDVVAHADDRHAAAGREHQGVQPDADDRLHAGRAGRWSPRWAGGALPYNSGQCRSVGDHARRGQVARELDGHKDRDEAIGLVWAYSAALARSRPRPTSRPCQLRRPKPRVLAVRPGCPASSIT